MADQNKPNGNGNQKSPEQRNEGDFRRELEQQKANAQRPEREATVDSSGKVVFGGADTTVPTMTLAEAMQSDKPEARQVVSDTFQRSNSKYATTKRQEKKWYLVDDDPEPIEAANPVEAMAIQNDRAMYEKRTRFVALGPHDRRKVVEISSQYADAAV